MGNSSSRSNDDKDINKAVNNNTMSKEIANECIVDHDHDQKVNFSTTDTFVVDATVTSVAAEDTFYNRISYAGATDYFKSRIPIAVVAPSLCGFSVGYYVGDKVAVYGYTTLLAVTLYSSAFFTGSYLLKEARQVDDAYNYSVSGCVSAGWLVSGFKGPRAGVAAAVVGGIGGAAYKVVGDMVYQLGREAWINHRINSSNSRKKVLVKQTVLIEIESKAPKRAYQSLDIAWNRAKENKKVKEAAKPSTELIAVEANSKQSNDGRK